MTTGWLVRPQHARALHVDGGLPLHYCARIGPSWRADDDGWMRGGREGEERVGSHHAQRLPFKKNPGIWVGDRCWVSCKRSCFARFCCVWSTRLGCQIDSALSTTYIIRSVELEVAVKQDRLVLGDGGVSWTVASLIVSSVFFSGVDPARACVFPQRHSHSQSQKRLMSRSFRSSQVLFLKYPFSRP